MPIEKDLLWQALRDSALSAFRWTAGLLALISGVMGFVVVILAMWKWGWAAWPCYVILVILVSTFVANVAFRYSTLKAEREIKSKYFSK